MKPYLNKIKKILIQNNCLNNTKQSAVIGIEETNVKLMRLKGRNFIYILCDKNQTIYVGRTKNLYTRILHHKASKTFTDIVLLEYNTNHLSTAEKYIVKLFKPKLNKCWVKYP